MPIDKTTFEEAQRPPEERILGLLRENPDTAYSLYEIFAYLENVDEHTAKLLLSIESAFSRMPGAAGRYVAYTETLSRLVQDGTLAQADYHGVTYYALAKALRPT